MFKEKIIIEMKEVFKEIPFGIEHTLKVLKNAEDIMKGEKKKNSSVLLLYYMILVRLKHKKNTVLLMVSIKKRKDQK